MLLLRRFLGRAAFLYFVRQVFWFTTKESLNTTPLPLNLILGFLEETTAPYSNPSLVVQRPSAETRRCVLAPSGNSRRSCEHARGLCVRVHV